MSHVISYDMEKPINAVIETPVILNSLSSLEDLLNSSPHLKMLSRRGSSGPVIRHETVKTTTMKASRSYLVSTAALSLKKNLEDGAMSFPLLHLHFHDIANEAIRMGSHPSILSDNYVYDEISRERYWKSYVSLTGGIFWFTLLRRPSHLFYIRLDNRDVLMIHPEAWGYPEASRVVIDMPKRILQNGFPDPLHGWLQQMSEDIDKEMEEVAFRYSARVRQLPPPDEIDERGLVLDELPKWASLTCARPANAIVSQTEIFIRGDGENPPTSKFDGVVENLAAIGLADEDNLLIQGGEGAAEQFCKGMGFNLENLRMGGIGNVINVPPQPDSLKSLNKSYALFGPNAIRLMLKTLTGGVETSKQARVTPTMVKSIAEQLGISGMFHFYWFCLFALNYPLPIDWDVILIDGGDERQYIHLPSGTNQYIHPLLPALKEVLERDYIKSECLWSRRGLLQVGCSECGSPDAIVDCSKCNDSFCCNCFINLHPAHAPRSKKHTVIPIGGCRYLREDEVEILTPYIPEFNIGRCNYHRFTATKSHSGSGMQCSCTWLTFPSELASETALRLPPAAVLVEKTANGSVKLKDGMTFFYYNFQNDVMTDNSVYVESEGQKQKEIISVQRFARGFLVRNRIAAWKEAVIIIQKTWKMIKCKRLFGSKGAVGSMALRWLYRWRARRRNADRTEYMARVQAQYRGMKLRLFMQKMVECTVKIQACMRSKIVRLNLVKRQEAALVIQKHVRGIRGRKLFFTMQDAAVSIQKWIRGAKGRQILVARHAAAKRIQALARGVLMREHRMKEIAAVTMIQSLWRRFEACRYVKSILYKKMDELHNFKLKQLFSDLKHSASTAISTHIKGYVVRQAFVRLKRKKMEGDRSSGTFIAAVLIGASWTRSFIHPWVRYLDVSIQNDLFKLKPAIQRALAFTPVVKGYSVSHPVKDGGDLAAHLMVLCLKQMMSHLPEASKKNAFMWAIHSVAHAAQSAKGDIKLPWQEIELGEGNGKIPPNRNENFMKLFRDPVEGLCRLENGALQAVDTQLDVPDENLYALLIRSLALPQHKRVLLAAALLVNSRHTLDQPDLTTEDTLPFHGVDGMRASQIMDVQSKEWGVDVPASWPLEHPKISELAAHCEDFFSGRVPMDEYQQRAKDDYDKEIASETARLQQQQQHYHNGVSHNNSASMFDSPHRSLAELMPQPTARRMRAVLPDFFAEVIGSQVALQQALQDAVLNQANPNQDDMQSRSRTNIKNKNNSAGKKTKNSPGKGTLPKNTSNGGESQPESHGLGAVAAQSFAKRKMNLSTLASTLSNGLAEKKQSRNSNRSFTDMARFEVFEVIRELASVTRRHLQAWDETSISRLKVEDESASVIASSENERSNRVLYEIGTSTMEDVHGTATLTRTANDDPNRSKYATFIAAVNQIFESSKDSPFDHSPFIVATCLVHIIFRGMLFRVRCDRAARTIQNFVRYKQRKHHKLRVEKPTVVLQKFTRGVRDALKIYRENQAALKIQSFVRSMHSKERDKNFKKSVVKIQSLIRGFLLRRWFHVRIANAAVKIQALFRGNLVRMLIGTRQLRKSALQTRIQIFKIYNEPYNVVDPNNLNERIGDKKLKVLAEQYCKALTLTVSARISLHAQALQSLAVKKANLEANAKLANSVERTGRSRGKSNKDAQSNQKRSKSNKPDNRKFRWSCFENPAYGSRRKAVQEFGAVAKSKIYSVKHDSQLMQALRAALRVLRLAMPKEDEDETSRARMNAAIRRGEAIVHILQNKRIKWDLHERSRDVASFERWLVQVLAIDFLPNYIKSRMVNLRDFSVNFLPTSICYDLSTAFVAAFLARLDDVRAPWFPHVRMLPSDFIPPVLRAHIVGINKLIMVKLKIAAESAAKGSLSDRRTSVIGVSEALWRTVFTFCMGQVLPSLNYTVRGRAVPMLYTIISRMLANAFHKMNRELWQRANKFFTTRESKYGGSRTTIAWEHLFTVHKKIFGTELGIGLGFPHVVRHEEKMRVLETAASVKASNRIGNFLYAPTPSETFAESVINMISSHTKVNEVLDGFPLAADGTAVKPSVGEAAAVSSNPYTQNDIAMEQEVSLPAKNIAKAWLKQLGASRASIFAFLEERAATGLAESILEEGEKIGSAYLEIQTRKYPRVLAAYAVDYSLYNEENSVRNGGGGGGGNSTVNGSGVSGGLSTVSKRSRPRRAGGSAQEGVSKGRAARSDVILESFALGANINSDSAAAGTVSSTDGELRTLMLLIKEAMTANSDPCTALAVGAQILLALWRGVGAIIQEEALRHTNSLRDMDGMSKCIPPPPFEFDNAFNKVALSIGPTRDDFDAYRLVSEAPSIIMSYLVRVQARWRGALTRMHRSTLIETTVIYSKGIPWPFDPKKAALISAQPNLIDLEEGDDILDGQGMQLQSSQQMQQQQPAPSLNVQARNASDRTQMQSHSQNIIGGDFHNVIRSFEPAPPKFLVGNSDGSANLHGSSYSMGQLSISGDSHRCAMLVGLTLWHIAQQSHMNAVLNRAHDAFRILGDRFKTILAENPAANSLARQVGDQLVKYEIKQKREAENDLALLQQVEEARSKKERQEVSDRQYNSKVTTLLSRAGELNPVLPNMDPNSIINYSLSSLQGPNGAAIIDPIQSSMLEDLMRQFQERGRALLAELGGEERSIILNDIEAGEDCPLAAHTDALGRSKADFHHGVGVSIELMNGVAAGASHVSTGYNNAEVAWVGDEFAFGPLVQNSAKSLGLKINASSPAPPGTRLETGGSSPQISHSYPNRAQQTQKTSPNSKLQTLPSNTNSKFASSSYSRLSSQQQHLLMIEERSHVRPPSEIPPLGLKASSSPTSNGKITKIDARLLAQAAQRLRPLWITARPVGFHEARIRIFCCLSIHQQQQYLQLEAEGKYAACITLLESAIPGNLNVLGDTSRVITRQPLLVEAAFQLLVGYIILAAKFVPPKATPASQSGAGNASGSVGSASSAASAAKLLQAALSATPVLHCLPPTHRAIQEAYLFETALSLCYVLQPVSESLLAASSSFYNHAAQRFLALVQPIRYVRSSVRYAAVLIKMRQWNEALFYLTKASDNLVGKAEKSRLAVALSHNRLLTLVLTKQIGECKSALDLLHATVNGAGAARVGGAVIEHISTSTICIQTLLDSCANLNSVPAFLDRPSNVTGLLNNDGKDEKTPQVVVGSDAVN